jgi:hypothetical protein
MAYERLNFKENKGLLPQVFSQLVTLLLSLGNITFTAIPSMCDIVVEDICEVLERLFIYLIIVAHDMICHIV